MAFPTEALATLDLAPLWLTLRLALIVTAILIVVATPLAWWIASGRSRAVPLVEAVVALPLVLPPTVLGFYLLVAFAPGNPLGQFWQAATGRPLAFSFTGLVVASLIYSLPFAVQPLRTVFAALGAGPREAAASLGAGPLDTFVSVVLPLSWRGYLSAAILSFAHTLGEFGVVLMVGGNIPGVTRLISIEIYERVETVDYAGAHLLAGILVVLSLAMLLPLYLVEGRARRAATR